MAAQSNDRNGWKPDIREVIRWAMRFVAILAATAAIATPFTVAAKPSDQPNLKYGCSDVVVIGRLKNVEGSYEHIDIEDDILGHGWITAQVRIKKVLKGHEPRRSVQARYLAHTYRVEDRDFVMVLRPVSGGSYTAQSFILLGAQGHPMLVSTCT